MIPAAARFFRQPKEGKVQEERVLRKIIELGRPEWEGDTLVLHCSDPSVSLEHLRPCGQMIVDSDACAFIYLAEVDGEDDYTYLFLPVPVWHGLRSAVLEHKRVVAVSKDAKLELVQLEDEFRYLLENIRGNSNYGNKMLENVEAIFSVE